MVEKIQQTLVKLEDSLNLAIAGNDPDAISQFISEDWVMIGSDGHQIERARFLGVIKSGDLSHTSMESDEWQVRVYQEAAIVTARVRSKGEWMGAPFEFLERSTSIYIQQDGLWRCVFTQLTSIETE